MNSTLTNSISKLLPELTISDLTKPKSSAGGGQIVDMTSQFTKINTVLGNIYKDSDHPFKVMSSIYRYYYNIAMGRYGESNFSSNYSLKFKRTDNKGKYYTPTIKTPDALMSKLDLLGLNTSEFKPTIKSDYEQTYKSFINDIGSLLDKMNQFLSKNSIDNYVSKSKQQFNWSASKDGSMFGSDVEMFLDIPTWVIKNKLKKEDYFLAITYVFSQTKDIFEIINKLCTIHKITPITTQRFTELYNSVEHNYEELEQWRASNQGSMSYIGYNIDMLNSKYSDSFSKVLADGMFNDAISSFEKTVSILKYMHSYLKYHYEKNFGKGILNNSGVLTQSTNDEVKNIKPSQTKPKLEVGSSDKRFSKNYSGTISDEYEAGYKLKTPPSQAVANLQVTLMHSIFKVLSKEKVNMLLDVGQYSARFKEIMDVVIAQSKVNKKLNDGYFGPLTLELLKLFRSAFLTSDKTPRTEIKIVDNEEFNDNDNRAVTWTVRNLIEVGKDTDSDVQVKDPNDVIDYVEDQIKGLSPTEQKERIIKIYNTLGIKNVNDVLIDRILRAVNDKTAKVGGDDTIKIASDDKHSADK